MKKLIMAIGIMMMISLSTFAQQGRSGEKLNSEDRATKMTEKFANELELSEDQKSQILAINLDFAKKREAEMEARKAEMEARRNSQKEHEAKIQAILTESQKAKWQELKDERKENRKRGHQGEGHHHNGIERKDKPKSK